MALNEGIAKRTVNRDVFESTASTDQATAVLEFCESLFLASEFRLPFNSGVEFQETFAFFA